MHKQLRSDGRTAEQLRDISYDLGVMKQPEGSCLIKIGNTHVICTASIEERVPPFLRGQRRGWVTAEYAMLPRATDTRTSRESTRGMVNGRTQEIQRLIGRALRAAIDLNVLGERQIIIDCDVINADGGTRTAAITGGYIALHLACQKLVMMGLVSKSPIVRQIAAVSCGIIDGIPLLDLLYSEDRSAEVDANFVFTNNHKLVEVQTTAENQPFSQDELSKMLSLAEAGIKQLFALQIEAINSAK